MDPAQNSWNEYSRLVLKELETLALGINSLRHEVADLKQEIAELRLKEDKVKELRDWKDKIDDVASPSQLREKIKQIDELNQFKTKAITINESGQVFLDAYPVTIPELETRLAQLKAADPELPVVVKGDAKVQYEKVIEVLDLIGRLEITQLGLVTQRLTR